MKSLRCESVIVTFNDGTSTTYNYSNTHLITVELEKGFTIITDIDGSSDIYPSESIFMIKTK